MRDGSGRDRLCRVQVAGEVERSFEVRFDSEESADCDVGLADVLGIFGDLFGNLERVAAAEMPAEHLFDVEECLGNAERVEIAGLLVRHEAVHAAFGLEP